MMKTITTLLVIFSLFELLPAQGITLSSNCEQSNFCSYEDGCGSAFAELTVSAYTDCSVGLLNYEYSVDLFDDGSQDLAGTENDASGDFPIGTHKITFNVSDDCGNSESCEFLFSIKDCVAPTSSIINGMALNLEYPGEVTLLAESLDNGSFDNCGVTSFLIVSPSQGPWQTEPPAEASPSFTFTCNNVGTNVFDFWVSDETGNWSYTPGYLIIQDNEVYCSTDNDHFLLCAFAKTEEGNPIGNVNYQLNGYEAPGFPDIFYGGCVPVFTQYINGPLTLNPLKDIDHLNGVSTYDMVLIAKHILGIQALPSPYKMIAADANKSGSISTLDLVEIRKLILGLNSNFPNNTSWRFVDSSFVFPNPSNPWATSIPEICQINTFDEDITKNYIGIKIGDVNGSAITDSLIVIDDRTSNERFIFQFENQKFEAGEEVLLGFKIKDFNNILGFQFGLNFNVEFLEFQGFKKGRLDHIDEANFGFNKLDNGIITASWFDLDLDQNDGGDEALFYLQFRALQVGQLKDLIKLNNANLKAEAYNEALDILDLGFDFYNTNAVSDTKLFQNQPNPFHENTFITFYISEAQSVRLKIIDIHGNLVKVLTNNFAEGYNQFEIQTADTETVGVYFYQLVTEDETITKKMVKF
jgi:Secretion system C-terminal sorting domain